MKSIAAMIIFTVLGHSAFATSNDITSPTSDLYIQVVKNQELRNFQLCSKARGPQSCVKLGKYTWYNVGTLEYQRKVEQFEAGGSMVASAALSALALFTVFGTVAFIVPTVPILWESAEVVALAGTGKLAVMAAKTAKLGPAEQLKQQYLLRGAVINDDQIVLDGKTDHDMQVIAARLDTILRKIK